MAAPRSGLQWLFHQVAVPIPISPGAATFTTCDGCLGDDDTSDAAPSTYKSRAAPSAFLQNKCQKHLPASAHADAITDARQIDVTQGY
jgi:hypothetical protein